MSNLHPFPPDIARKALERRGGSSDSGGMPPEDLSPRVAVLEHIAKTTSEGLSEIKAELRAMRGEMNGRIDKVDDRMRSETRWLLVTMTGMFLLLAGIMAKGFKWF